MTPTTSVLELSEYSKGLVQDLPQ